MLRSSCPAFVCLTVLLPLSRAQSLSLSPSPDRSGAAVSDNLDPSFAGFGIEPSNLFSFTGWNEPNEFSIQLLQNLADYSGSPPHIRIGGNTQDYMIYDADYEDFGWKKNSNSTAQGVIAADSMIIGPNYLAALDRFPKDTFITYGLNLAYEGDDYLDHIVTHSNAVVKNLQNTRLYSFEIGNEPDLYLENGMRAAPWDGKTFTTQFMERADTVYQKVLKPAGMAPTFFEPPATASTIGTTFEIAMLNSDGILDRMNGEYYVGWWNQHDYFYFIGVTPTPITLDDLMDMDQTNTQFAYWEKQVKIALDTGVPYVLREMSSIGPIGMHQVSDTFGAALWTLNFFLYTATLNISAVHMHMTDNSNASAWQPINVYGKEPFVRPQYYAHAAVAQIIGNGNGTTQIGALDVGGAGGDYTGRIRAYSAYANSALQAVILINSKQANASESNKASFTFNVNMGSANANKKIYISYLTADGADSLTGTSWNGMSFSDEDGKASVVDESIYQYSLDGNGAFSIAVRDSEAVVANIDWQLGSNKVIKVDGTTTSGSRRKNSGSPSVTGAKAAVWTAVLVSALTLATSLGAW
ncbi:uncharacterized protein N0V89_007059 [Didymosphaeria variabile]|uniref:Beta-glucuronidase C-terminal domain-containing protein n=1 Tax=Didymosphaeria variabile TaxID=1932322 RepID=A0A9W9CAG6_9PLEO|nr:uncharacterized protein N0V89_007059 [Didymosphaeria variabile]KAJ4351716.1 hypothetical protein N0V89_007059 [Didymosphaeria variabile]